jgi:hypothetical protein
LKPTQPLLAFISCAAAMAQQPAEVRILTGATDTQSARWDGSVEARNATITSLEPWRFDTGDEISGTSWKMATHPIRLFGNGTQFDPQGIRSVVANGLIVRLNNAAPNASLSIDTAQGRFDLNLSEIPYGKGVYKLNGKVFADRVPPTTRLTESPDEEDYPSAASDAKGNVWIAYFSFHHSPDHDQLRAPLRTALTNFDRLKEPVGGDQVFVRHFASGKWEDPIAVTGAGGDFYRTAVAIDGQGRPWVFWSQNTGGNFDIHAQAIENGKPARHVRISSEAGSDIDPVAVSDSGGRVWVAWQSWRNGKASIFAAAQNATGFTSPAIVSQSPGNEWNPAIAADKSGRIAVAWDSYRNGNYDVYLRTNNAGRWEAERPVATSEHYEAYPSIAYDGASRLWVAWEESGSGWGKDFGAYQTTGIALYQGRVIRLRGFEPGGRAIELSADPAAALAGAPSLQADKPGAQNQNVALGPDPDKAANRPPNRPAPNQQNPKNTSPRLSIDASGRIWLAFRTAHPIWWNPIGTVWSEYVTSFDGSKWSSPVFLTHSDNLLDNRPALLSTAPGRLTIVGSSDGRRQFPIPERFGATTNLEPAPRADPFNNDLYANEIDLGPAAGAPEVVAAPPPITAPPADRADAAAVKRMRDYRLNNLRIVRGEFHRHSEVSMDGGFDGSLLDQWRYILDSAALDWVGCCDHDNGGGREYTWWTTQKLTDIFYLPGKFVPMFNYERSVAYPEGHRNVIFVQRGIRPLPRLPKTDDNAPGRAPDTQMLYAYLKHFNGIVASHTSGTNMGTDWRDNDPVVEPLVEIYQGDRQNYEMPNAPRANSASDSIGGWRPKGFVNLALEKGYKLAFEASSDHVSTHMSYTNILVTAANREAVLDALLKRHVYGATDNIVADVRSGNHLMGDSFSTASRPSLRVKLMGTAKFTKVSVIRDNTYVYSAEPGTADVSFSWMDNSAQPGKMSYYYVRGEQEDGQIVWVSPMWITYTGGN